MASSLKTSIVQPRSFLILAISTVQANSQHVNLARAGLRRGLRSVRNDEFRSFERQEQMRTRSVTADGGIPASPSSSSIDENTPLGSNSFCIIEGPEAVQDFAQMQLQEIRDNIRSRRNKIFLLMEEVRRLRVQQRIKSAEQETVNEENEMPNFPSVIPFLPPLTSGTLKQYYIFCISLVAGIILFGGLLAPILELKLGIGGTNYKDFIQNMNLPLQLSQVDPIVASFSGGAVGVISSLMLIEVNNVKLQEQKRCKYCCGTGYLACARCSGKGVSVLMEPMSSNGLSKPSSSQRCPNCSGAGKVMCPTCLCTGTELASEHDPRIDPFL